MSKRVKYNHEAGMVAHLWAHKSQDSARSKGRGQLFFDGDTIYSYGLHFPIARHVTTKRGSAVLFTTQSYSQTTNRHKFIVGGACQNLTVFHVDRPDSTDYRKAFADYGELFLEAVKRYTAARGRKPYILAEMRRIVKEANDFASFFALRTRLKMPPDLSKLEAECKAIVAREREAQKRAMVKLEREYAERRAKALVDLESWVKGGTKNTYYGDYGLPTRLRIVGDTLETSHGAEVPLDHAIKAFRIIKRLRNKGETYQRNGHTIHLGGFALDSVDTQGNVTAGCHKVEWAEIERVAILVGVN